jgi:hypothetical protein
MAAFRPARALLIVLVVLAAGLGLPIGHLAPVDAARGSATPLSGAINGPSVVGLALQATYVITGTGGPAEAANGSQVGIYSYHSSYSAVNTTGASFTPTSGVLVNGTVTLSFTAPNVTEPVTLFVLVNSSFDTSNVSTNLSLDIQIVQPYRLSANLQVGSSAGVSPFYLTVTLDGSPVGNVKVPSLTAGATYPITFSYVTPGGISPGWHTFSINLAQEHGLVTFQGGVTSYTVSFYVPGPPPDNTPWYLLGLTVFIAVILIYSMRVGAPRRGTKKK